MKTLLLAVSVAFGLATTTFATTTDTLKICVNNTSCITVTDNGPLDTDGGAVGQITYNNPSFNNWNVQVVSGDSGSASDIQSALDLSVKTATCNSNCAGQQLEVFYSDINFDVPAAAGKWDSSYSGTVTGHAPTGGSTSQYAWVDTSNTIFGQPGGSAAVPQNGPYSGTAPFTFGSISQDTFGGAGVNPSTPGGSVSNPYSVTIEQIFSDNGMPGSIKFSTDGSISGSPIPEPTAIILFGTVVALCTSKLRRRRTS